MPPSVFAGSLWALGKTARPAGCFTHKAEGTRLQGNATKRVMWYYRGFDWFLFTNVHDDI